MSETPNRISAEVTEFNARASAEMRRRTAELEGDPTVTGKFNCPSCDIAGGRWSHALGCDRGTGRTASGTLSALGYPGYGEDFAAAVLAACEEGMSPAFAIECELGYRRSRRELTAGGAFGSFAVDGEES